MVLAYHGPAGQDPYSYFSGNNIIGLMGYTGYPTAYIGRRVGPLTYPGWNNPVVIQSNLMEPGVSINVVKSYNSTTHQLDVTANVTSLRQIDTTCNINFVLTEDYLIYNQVNNNVCIPGGSNYVHKWTVRNMVNGATGEMLSTGTWAPNVTKVKNWTTTLDNAWIAGNCRVNVFVYFSAGGSLGTQSYVQQTKKESVLTGIHNENEIAENYSLSQNYPNPFNPVTNIHFSLPKDGNVSLKFYDMVGNEVATYVEGFMMAGTYNAEFDGSNLASGIYFYTLRADNFVDTKKMTLIK